MASTPNEVGPVPENQQAAGGPGTTGDLTSRQEENQPQQLPPGSAADSAHHEDQSRSRSLLEKILRPIALAVVGGVLLIVALMLYSAPGQLSAPTYASLDVRSDFPLSTIGYVVNQVSPSIAMIRIELILPTGVLHQPAKTSDASIDLFPPPGIAFQPCSAGCSYIRSENIYSWSGTLKINAEFNFGGGNLTGAAIATFYIKAHDFGYVSNSVNASAAIPEVTYQGPGSPLLGAAYYDATSVSTYDWSALPPETANGTTALWDEPLVSGATQGRIATGINQANETKDNNKTFFAGALIGLAGGALLSAVQEALHAND